MFTYYYSEVEHLIDAIIEKQQRIETPSASKMKLRSKFPLSDTDELASEDCSITRHGLSYKKYLSPEVHSEQHTPASKLLSHNVPLGRAKSLRDKWSV
jgi:hypothetical protein